MTVLAAVALLAWAYLLTLHGRFWQAGPVLAPAAWFCKHPPQQMTDDEAYEAVESFIAEGAPAP